MRCLRDWRNSACFGRKTFAPDARSLPGKHNERRCPKISCPGRASANLIGNTHESFSAYVSANGVRPAFYGHAGLKLVEGCGFIPDPKTGAIHRSSETLVWQFLMDLSYPRGEYVARLVARRICRAVDQINASGGIDFLRKAVAADKDDAREILMPLYGMGPKTFEVFWGLSREACAQSEA